MKDRKDIDQLFREGLNAEEAAFTVPDEEWEKMEQRLNRHHRRKRGMIWLVRVGSVAALILVVFALGILITDHVPPMDEQAMVKQQEQVPPVGTSKSADSLQQANKAPEGLPMQKAVNDSTSPAALTERTVEGLKQPSGAADPTIVENKTSEKLLLDTATGNRAENRVLQTDSLQLENIRMETFTRENEVIARETTPTETDTVPAAENKSLQVEEPVMAGIEEPLKQPDKEQRFRGMALSVMAAPAYNAVNSLDNGSMGGDYGLLLTFAIARNWSISTGGVYAKKLYETGFRDYNPKNNIWHEYYPLTVNADCRVLDIPLNVSYTLLKAKGRTISMGTGISSYIMLREDYSFTYEENEPDNPLAYSVVNENRHWLSVVNLQATIDQRLSKRISVSLQPYMKIPLGNIGFAGVKLQSLGLAAHLNWNFGI